jgi:hypothetical protein
MKVTCNITRGRQEVSSKVEVEMHGIIWNNAIYWV